MSKCELRKFCLFVNVLLTEIKRKFVIYSWNCFRRDLVSTSDETEVLRLTTNYSVDSNTDP